MITKDMLISEIVQKYPDAARTMMMAGMGCIGCAIAQAESLEDGCAAHGIDPDDMVEVLNDIINAAPGA